MDAELSPTQLKALALATEGELHRRRGGYWAPRKEPSRASGAPVRWVGTRTVEALDRRGLLEQAGYAGFGLPPRQITDAGRAALAKAEGRQS